MKRNREYIPYLRNLVGHKEIRATGVTALIINEKEEVLLEKRSRKFDTSRPLRRQ